MKKELRSKKPIQVKLTQSLEAELRKICEANQLPMSTVVNMCAVAGVSMVKTKLEEMRQPAKAA